MHTCDITDNWAAATDPENERGEEASALFVQCQNGWALHSILARDLDQINVIHRPLAQHLLGKDEVRRLERLVEKEMEERDE